MAATDTLDRVLQDPPTPEPGSTTDEELRRGAMRGFHAANAWLTGWVVLTVTAALLA